MTKINLIEGSENLHKAIDAAAKTARKGDMEWQRLALSAINHFHLHGDVVFINKVYLSMGKGARHEAMAQYFTLFGGVSANKGESKATLPFLKDGAKKVDLEKAATKMWFDLKKSKAPDEEIDYFALAMKLVKREPTEKQTALNASLRIKLGTMLREYAEEHDLPTDGIPATVEIETETDELSGVSQE